MANRKIVPESRTCPVCSTSFEVGGRGRPPRKAIYCSRKCQGVTAAAHLPTVRGSHAPRPRKNLDTLHNEAWLRAKYLDERLSTGDIAKLLGCSTPSVRWALRKFAISARSMSDAKRGRPSMTTWTPDMRESLAAKRRGEANPYFGKPSVNRNADNWHPDPRIRNLRQVRANRRGMTGVEYDAMFEAQAGVCAICGRSERKRSKSGYLFTLAVDHNHATGAIRALLCNDCNACLGLLQENPDTLRSMIAYLERHLP